MKTLQAYKGDENLKAAFVKEIEKHRKADAIIQGTYGEQNGSWKGCAVACSLRSLAILDNEALQTDYRDHALYETKLGIPEWLARLEDRIFEGLPKKKATLWPEQFAKAIPVGANLEPVKWQFSAFLLKENIERVLTLKDISDELKEQVVSAIRGVLTIHETAIRTGKWDESAWSAAWSAASAAWSAAWSAESAWSAAWSAASAARSAAWSAESAESAWSAAESAAESAWSAAESAWSAAESAASAAESAAYIRYSKELLKLLAAQN